jgi:hypothetical protein
MATGPAPSTCPYLPETHTHMLCAGCTDPRSGAAISLPRCVLGPANISTACFHCLESLLLPWGLEKNPPSFSTLPTVPILPGWFDSYRLPQHRSIIPALSKSVIFCLPRQKVNMDQPPVAHTYNPSYSGSRDQEDRGWQIVCKTISWKIHHKKGLVVWLKV